MLLDNNLKNLPAKSGYCVEESFDQFSGKNTVCFGFKKANVFFTIRRIGLSERSGRYVTNGLGVVPTLIIENGTVKEGYIRFVHEASQTKHFTRNVSFLFEDGKILSPEIIARRKDALWYITKSELNLFATEQIKILRVETDSNDVRDYDFLDISKYYKHRPDYLSTAFRLFLQDFASVAKNNYQWEPVEHLATASNDAVLNETDFEKLADFCYVYLMYDRSNGFYKIGVSNNPQYRESTLQSEKPTIEKIVEKRYPSRKIAMAIEASIHKVFDSQRVRGEWFRLGPVDIWQIKETLK